MAIRTSVDAPALKMSSWHRSRSTSCVVIPMRYPASARTQSMPKVKLRASVQSEKPPLVQAAIPVGVLDAWQPRVAELAYPAVPLVLEQVDHDRIVIGGDHGQPGLIELHHCPPEQVLGGPLNTVVDRLVLAGVVPSAPTLADLAEIETPPKRCVDGLSGLDPFEVRARPAVPVPKGGSEQMQEPFRLAVVTPARRPNAT